MDIQYGLFLLIVFSLVATVIRTGGTQNGFSNPTIAIMLTLSMVSCLGIGVFLFPPSNLYIGSGITFVTFEIAIFISKRLRQRALRVLDENNSERIKGYTGK
jgi:uncharacterized membrane protein